MFGTLGVGEIAIIFIVALVLFGPRKLPELGRTIGKAMTEFRRASNDLKATFEREMHSLERENQSLQQATRETADQISALASYEPPPAESVWNPLEQEPTATQPAIVGASEVSGAESNGTSETAAAEPVSQPAQPGEAAALEGTVPRGAAPEEPAPDTVQKV
jgi:sec-independent protein translocase protein TatA